MTSYQDIVGLNLRRARQAAQITQEELAFRAEITRAYLSRIESGRCNLRLDTLVRLAEVLQTTPDILLKRPD